MSEIVRVKLEDGSEASVGAAYAEVHGFTVLDKPATDRRGKALPAKPKVDISLRGGELDDQLTRAGLSTSGSLADRQDRLAEFVGNNPGALDVPPDEQDAETDTGEGDNGGGVQ